MASGTADKSAVVATYAPRLSAVPAKAQTGHAHAAAGAASTTISAGTKRRSVPEIFRETTTRDIRNTPANR